MRKVLIVSLVSAAGTAALVSVTASGQTRAPAERATSAPILAGPWGSYQEGYGHVEPRTIFNGGDGSGLVNHIEWLTWGGQRAVGLGIGLYAAPGQSNAEGTRESAIVVLFHLGACHGRRAYDAVTWFFPQHGEHFNPRQYINACSGSYHQ